MSANKVLDALRDISPEDRAKVRALPETISDEAVLGNSRRGIGCAKQDSYRKSGRLE